MSTHKDRSVEQAERVRLSTISELVLTVGMKESTKMLCTTSLSIEPNHTYNVHSTRQSDEISESGQYELVIPTESAANVIVQQNQAYNIITTQPATDCNYEEIPENIQPSNFMKRFLCKKTI